MTAILCACAPRVRHDVERGVVVEAKMLSVVKVFPQTNVFDIEDFDTGGWVEFRLKAEKSLIGRTTERTFVARMKVSAFPREGSRLYVVGATSADGAVLVEHWNWVSNGLCVGRELAKSLGIEAEMFQLRRERIVETDPACELEWQE